MTYGRSLPQRSEGKSLCLSKSIEINNKYTVNYVCTDKLKTYTSYRYESDKNTINDRYIPNNKQLSENLIKKYKSDKDNELKQFSIHIRSKTETCLIECVNNRIRHYLARFRRKRTLGVRK